MNEGEWKTNRFADPDVRKVFTDLMDKKMELGIELGLLHRYIKWIEATYPNIKAEYQAIRDLEDASRERVEMRGFGEAQAKMEGGHVSY